MTQSDPYRTQSPAVPSLYLSEVFASIQGEGIYTGEPMFFVRFQGCSLGCVWCDTKYSWAEGPWKGTVVPLYDLLAIIQTAGLKKICITGGEPLEQPEVFEELVQALKYSTAYGGPYWIEVETSGLVPLPEGPLFDLVDSWVVDLKCPGAGTYKSPVLGDLARLRAGDQLKCVVANPVDLEYVVGTLKCHPTDAVVLISPATPVSGRADRDWAQEVACFCVDYRYRLNLQIHKFLWGSKRGV